MLKKTIDVLVLSSLWIFSIQTLFDVLGDGTVIGWPNYIGFGLLILLTILKVLKVRKFRTMLAVFLIAGSFNLFQFTSSTITFVFTFSPLGHDFSTLGVQPLCSFLTLLFTFAYIREIRLVLQKFSGVDQESKEESMRDAVDFFYEKLMSKPDEELNKIVSDSSSYQLGCVHAARKLIAERKSEHNMP